MIRRIDIKDPAAAEAVLHLQRSAYREEARLIRYESIPPLIETLDALMTCGETFLGYHDQDLLVGMLSYKIDEDLLDLHRIAVHPDHFRRGIAQKMLSHLLERESWSRVLVSTGAANGPAIQLYLKQGFGRLRDTTTPDGLAIANLELLRSS